MLNGVKVQSNNCMAELQMMAQGAPLRQPALDEAINAIHDEVMKYYNGLNSLICKLEAPKPTNTGCGSDKVSPATIGEALQDIYNILCNTNEGLQVTIKRIDEQVGDFKLLP